MKFIIMILIYVISFVSLFLLLSTVGMIWFTYREAINSVDWLIAYTVFIGWWVSLFPCRDYYMANRKDFWRLYGM